MNGKDEQASLTGANNRFAVTGPLTFATVEALVRLPVDWSAGRESVTIDLAGVPRADSAGLALMVKWWRDARRAGRSLQVVNAPARLQDLIRVNGLQGLFPANNG